MLHGHDYILMALITAGTPIVVTIFRYKELIRPDGIDFRIGKMCYTIPSSFQHLS